VSTDDILLGLGLVLAIAVSSQLLAARLRLPAIVVLLPAGFIAGAITDVVHPDKLLGALFQPFVSIAVGVILFEAGLRLSLRDVEPDARKTVLRLVGLGGLVTWVGVSAAAALLIDGVGDGVPVLIGAILVVSGPTVVLPLLAFVRPSHRVRTLLMWEGVLVDPVGAILGVIVFGAVRSASQGGQVYHPGEMVASLGIGALVGVAGAAVLWVLLRETQQTAPRQAIPATLMVVVAAVVAADLLRDDSGFVAATLMGAVLADQRRIDVTLTLDFSATLVQLLIGALFVLIAASVTPSEVRDVLAEALLLVGAMVLVVRPLAVAAATARSPLSTRERMFVAWMAPRGIVAGATASGFGLQLQQAGVTGAGKILPIVFVAIFGTVLIYGLTAAPVARLLGVAGAGGTTVLIVGGHPWARAIAEALRSAGVGVRLWAARAQEQADARAAGLQAAPGRLMVDALSREAELEEVTDALVLTGSDDFNALAAAELRVELGHGHVFRAASDHDHGDFAPIPGEAGIIADGSPSSAELDRYVTEGWQLVEREDGDGLVLFVVGAGGEIRVATDATGLWAGPGERLIVLSPAGAAG
jgi:NhaP-type Na+/H+ or K+/H+ antiporter